MKKFEIYTPYGDCFKVNELGQMTSKNSNTFSDTWKIQGIEHVKKSWFIPFDKITPETIAKLQLRYKNGNPQFTVRDLDHGSTRTWGNTKYHGISNICFIN